MVTFMPGNNFPPSPKILTATNEAFSAKPATAGEVVLLGLAVGCWLGCGADLPAFPPVEGEPPAGLLGEGTLLGAVGLAGVLPVTGVLEVGGGLEEVGEVNVNVAPVVLPSQT